MIRAGRSDRAWARCHRGCRGCRNCWDQPSELQTCFTGCGGDRSDLIIDFLTYVFIPAFALFKSGLLAGWTGWFAIIAITYGSVIYFADTRMKTKDKSFAGFPACWNMVILVLFAVTPPQGLVLAIVVALTVAMFTNLKFIHPTRTKRWRNLSLPISIMWVVFAGWAAWADFQSPMIVHWGLILTSLYLIFAGIAQQILPERPGAKA